MGISIEAKRQALNHARRDAETNGGTSAGADGDRSGHSLEAPKNGMGVPLLVALSEGLTSQFDVGGIAARR